MQGITTRFARPGLAAALGLSLTACGTSAPETPLTCPRPAIVDELASAEQYRPGGGPVPENLAYRVALENIRGTCRLEGADQAISVTIDVVVEPGVAFVGPSVEVPYFVAVLGADNAVLDRQDFLARVSLAPGVRRAGSVESFSQRLRRVGRSGGGNYRVLFGLALPADEAMRRAPAG
jgi:hypothetical protein